MRNQVQLITYADRLAGDIPGLDRLLHDELAGLFAGVHLLPFFTPFDGDDAGFDPDDHTAVDPRLGTWDDVTRLGRDIDVMADVIVNHVSARSPQFRDWLAHGDASRYAAMFLTLGGVFPDGATERDLVAIYRPRPGLPFTTVSRADGSRRLVWTTFTPAQVDIDVSSEPAQAYLRSVLDTLADAGAASVRLDAVGYAAKTPGTSSFMTPETFAFIDELAGMCRERGLRMLVEVHSYYERQIEIARQVDLVYDFALPPLVLHALITGDPLPLHRWLDVRPRNCITVLDTHDGIGVIDVGADPADSAREGLLSPPQVDSLVRAIHDNSNQTSAAATEAGAGATTVAAPSNQDLYQVNCTFYDALGRNDRAYLIARAMQFFAPGVPQVYYVGLLAGTNDMDLPARTDVGRDVNRHHFSHDEVVERLDLPVVQALTNLIRLRNWHSAFDGEFTSSGDATTLAMAWRSGGESARLTIDFAARSAGLDWTVNGQQHSVPDLLQMPRVPDHA